MVDHVGSEIRYSGPAAWVAALRPESGRARRSAVIAAAIGAFAAIWLSVILSGWHEDDSLREALLHAGGSAMTGVIATLCLVGFVVTFLRRDAEGERAETRLRDYVEASSEWFWETDKNDRYMYVSSGLPGLHGVRGRYFLGRERACCAVGVSSSAAWAEHRRQIAARRPFRDFVYEERVRGESRIVKVSGKPVFDRDGQFIGYRGTGTDLTERIQAEQRLAAAVESLEEGFALYNTNDKLVLCNESYLKANDELRDVLVPGTPMETILRTMARRGLIPEAVGREDEWIEERIGFPARRNGLRERRLKNGQCYLLKDERLPSGETVSLAVDITHRKNNEAALIEARERAERADAAKSVFLTTMSHELRTPLNAVIGFAEVIKDRAETGLSDADAAEYADDIMASGLHLLQIINDILDLSQMQSGQFELDRQVVDLGALVGTAAELVNPFAKERNIVIETDARPGGIAFIADPRAVKQIVYNLLHNGVKFSEAGGTVLVRTARDGDESVVLEVQDTGVGIAEADLERVLQPFEQARDVLNSTSMGAGLGLSLVRNLVQLHGGQFDITSSEGEGTIIRVTLPKDTPQTPGPLY